MQNRKKYSSFFKTKKGHMVWDNIYDSQIGKCAICHIALNHTGRWCPRSLEEKIDRLHMASIDHIIPLSLGGDNSTNNLQILCIPCNSSKGNKILC